MNPAISATFVPVSEPGFRLGDVILQKPLVDNIFTLCIHQRQTILLTILFMFILYISGKQKRLISFQDQAFSISNRQLLHFQLWLERHELSAMSQPANYFLRAFLRPYPARPARPLPKSSMVAGSGTGAAVPE